MAYNNQKWHNSKTYNDKVLIFHNEYARQPYIVGVQAKLELLKNDIQSQMNIIGPFTSFEFKHKGSVYEGVKIMQSEHDCLKFDLGFVIDGGEYLVAEKSHPSWHVLKVKDGALNVPPIIRMTQENGVLSPIKILELFYRSLSKCAFVKDYDIKLRYHGPAVQMVVSSLFANIPWFQVDLAPTFYLEGNNPNDPFLECYMAKSPDDSFRNMWYRSHSAEESELMDQAGGTRKDVLRILKAMRANSIQFLGLQNYHFKMALFHVMEEFPNDDNWTNDTIGQRLIDVLFYIRNCLEKKEMPNYFNKDLNILKLSYNTRLGLKNRITILIEKEQRMLDFLNKFEKTDIDTLESIKIKTIFYIFFGGFLLGVVFVMCALFTSPVMSSCN